MSGSLPAAEVDLPMTKGDREELKSLARQQARVEKAGVEERKAAVLAHAEAQLSATYNATAEDWAHLTTAAEQAVKAADAQIAEICRQRGIPESFRPGLHLAWYSRGENAEKARRAELRKLAERRVDAEARAAKLAIDRASLEILTQLATAALTTEAARSFLAGMPSLPQLMPELDVRELGAGS